MRQPISLDQLHIPTSCSADWSAMPGDERTRFCDACGKHVHDLSTRSRVEAEALLSATSDLPCVQFSRDRRGRIVTRDGLWRFSIVRRTWPVMSMVLAFALGVVGCRRGSGSYMTGTPLPGEADIQSTPPHTRTVGIIDARAKPATTQATSLRDPSDVVMGDVDLLSLRGGLPATRPVDPPASRPAD